MAWTFRALLAGLVFLAGLLLAVDAQSTQSASEPDLTQPQQVQEARDILSVTRATGDLKKGILYWNEGPDRWYGATSDGPSDTYYTTLEGVSDQPLKSALNETADRVGLSYNLEVQYRTSSGSDRETQRLIYQGPPGDDAVQASTIIVLFDDDRIVTPSGQGQTLAGADFYAPDVYSGDRYNDVRVVITLWM